jgi:DNA-binding CsgD family transcriptional regulator
MSLETTALNSQSNPQYAAAFSLSAPERRLLLALVWGETLLQAAARLEIAPHEAEQMLTDLQQRVGVPTRHALMARAVAHHWII